MMSGHWVRTLIIYVFTDKVSFVSSPLYLGDSWFFQNCLFLIYCTYFYSNPACALLTHLRGGSEVHQNCLLYFPFMSPVH